MCNKIVSDLKKEYSLYEDKALVILAKKYFNIDDGHKMTRDKLIERMVSIELHNAVR